MFVRITPTPPPSYSKSSMLYMRTCEVERRKTKMAHSKWLRAQEIGRLSSLLQRIKASGERGKDLGQIHAFTREGECPYYVQQRGSLYCHLQQSVAHVLRGMQGKLGEQSNPSPSLGSREGRCSEKGLLEGNPHRGIGGGREGEARGGFPGRGNYLQKWRGGEQVSRATQSRPGSLSFNLEANQLQLRQQNNSLF